MGLRASRGSINEHNFLKNNRTLYFKTLKIYVYLLTQQFKALEFVLRKLFVNCYLRGSITEQLRGEPLILNCLGSSACSAITSNETTDR